MNRSNRLVRVFRQIFLPVLLFLSYQAGRTLFAQELNKPSEPFKKYNVVLVFIDTLRADHLSCYGYSRKTSPNIDNLAKESTIFERNFTPATYTLPSFMSIITSIYPISHGVFEIYKDKLSPRVTTLAQILKIYGYKTAWFGPSGAPHLEPKIGFGWGFDEICDSGDVSQLEQVKNSLCDWLDKNKDQRFFLNFHTYKAHSPYLPDPKYKARFTKIKSMEGVVEDIEEYDYAFIKQVAKNKKLAVELMGEDLFKQFIACGLPKGGYRQIEDFFISRKEEKKLAIIQDFACLAAGMNLRDKSINAYVQILYDACILEYDEKVLGPVIEKLKALNLYDKTIIIICSDHGEEFYEHGGFSHGTTLYDEVTRVPLIIHVPWIKQAKKVNEFTQTVDILPTLLDLLQIPIPHQAQGKSLVGLINNKKASFLYENVFGTMKILASIRSGEWLLVLNNKDPDLKELYNLGADSGQHHNLYSKRKDIVLKLEAQYKKWKTSLPSYVDQECSFPPEIGPAMQERIRKTGYW